MRQRNRIPGACVALLLTLAVGLSDMAAADAHGRVGFPSRLYSSSSPFNRPIGATPSIAPESGRMVQGLAQAAAAKGFVLTVGRWTVPVFLATATTRRRTVQLGEAPARWGVRPGYRGFPPGWSDSLERQIPAVMRGVPIPAAARPDRSLDAHMTIVDPARNCEYDFYGAQRDRGGWQAIWGNSTPLDGPGVYPYGMGTKASGFAGAAGLIWPRELRAGRIEHALLFAYPDTKAGGPVWPATSSDGLSTAVGAMPEGTRVQLDPGLDLDSLGLSPYQRTIAEALQRYGMVLGDTGGAFGLFAVGRPGRSNPYKGLLPRDFYPDLSAIPIDRFRVLASAPQVAEPVLKTVPNRCSSFG